MKRVDELLADYGSYHRTRGNLVCHAVGVPLIVFGIFSFLRLVPLPMGGTAAGVLIAAAFIFYAALDLPLAVALLVPEALLYAAARAADSWKVGLATFAVGWIFQGIGHARYEHKAPAFVRNLVHLLIGPLFLVNELLRVRPPLSARTAEK
ncbi:MAG: Mpo1-like protein [Acidobacteriota bacterium]